MCVHPGARALFLLLIDKRLRRAVSNLFLTARQIAVVLAILHAVRVPGQYEIGAARACVRFTHPQKRPMLMHTLNTLMPH